jgi:hypothetical protein
VFRQENAINPGRIAGAQYGSQVVRVFDVVEKDDERQFSKPAENIRCVDMARSFGSSEQRNDSLMISAPRQAVKVAPIAPLYCDS